jgi:WD40 repeat protein
MTTQNKQAFFTSLDDLQSAHLELTQRFLYGGALLEKHWQDVAAFITKAQATGAILTNDSDRYTAQNLIDEWDRKLAEVRKEVPDTRLLPVDESLVTNQGSSRNVITLTADNKQPYPSLLVLQTAHADLNKRFRDGATATDDVWQDIETFIAKGRVTGALLTDDNERYAAQSLLDYWATTIYRYKQQSLDTTLFPFDESSITELTDDDYPYKNLPMPSKDLITPRELRFAIEGPAKAIGLTFEDGVIEALLRDVRDEEDAWSLLELILSELWQKRQRNKITWAAYQELGGVAGLLNKKAETFYGLLEPPDQDIAKKILLRLVRLDEWQQPTSHPVSFETLYTSFNALGISREKVEGILAKLEAARVIKREEDGSVSLFHTALLKDWPRLAEWLQDSATRERLNLTAAAEQWEATGKDEGALWWGKLLSDALNYRDLDKLESEFLEVSRQRRERRIQRRNILLSIGFASVLMLAALALVGWRYAILARRFAEAQSNIVTAFLDKQFDVALLLAVKTYQQVDDDSAQKGLLSALRYTQQAYAPFLPVRYLHGHNTEVAQVAFSDDGKVAATDATFEAGRTLTVWDVASGSPVSQNDMAFTPAASGLSLVESVRGRVFRVEATSSPWQALNNVRADFFTKDSKSEVRGAALSPDGETLALGYSDGAVILWWIQTPDQPFLGQRLSGFGETIPIRKSVFSQTGQRLALTSDPTTIVLWEITPEEAQQRATIPVGKAAPRSIAISSDGQLLAWLESNNQIKLWDVQSNQEANATALDALDTDILSLAFGADNQFLLGQRNGRVSQWNLQDGNVRHINLQTFEGSILNVALSSKGILAVTDSGGFASLWRIENGEPILNPLSISGYITALAFNSSGDKLALGTRSGTIILWDVTRQEVVSELSTGAESPVSSLAFINNEQLVSSSSDGRVLLWKVDVESLIREACQIANPPLEADKNEQYGDLNSVCLEAPANSPQ